MIPIVVGLTATATALLMGLLILQRRDTVLRAREQAYEFHELRDRLQTLAIGGQLETRSVAYAFLIESLNLAIRNAGVMRLSQVLKVARAVKTNADNLGTEQIIEDVHQQGKDTQKLYHDFFGALIRMLVSNDHLTSWMFSLATFSAEALNRAAVRAITSVGRALLPERTDAIYEARRYQRWRSRVYALSY
jgi:hypothetical protein